MLNLNKHTKANSKPKQTRKFKNCSHVCSYHCAQPLYTTQHRTVLIIFPPKLGTIIIAQMLSFGEEVALVFVNSKNTSGDVGAILFDRPNAFTVTQ